MTGKACDYDVSGIKVRALVWSGRSTGSLSMGSHV